MYLDRGLIQRLICFLTLMILSQGGVWITSSDYKNAQPDPLRDFAEKLVNEINTNNIEDINRFCNIYADLNFQVCANQLFVIVGYVFSCILIPHYRKHSITYKIC